MYKSNYISRYYLWPKPKIELTHNQNFEIKRTIYKINVCSSMNVYVLLQRITWSNVRSKLQSFYMLCLLEIQYCTIHNITQVVRPGSSTVINFPSAPRAIFAVIPTQNEVYCLPSTITYVSYRVYEYTASEGSVYPGKTETWSSHFVNG